MPTAVDGGAMSSGRPRYIDIGINLTDPVYSGIYHGTQRHPDDLAGVLTRAREAGCQKLIITGSDLAESEKAIAVAKKYPGFLYTTVGVHPCTSQTFINHSSGSSFVLSSLRALAEQHSTSQSPIVAFGEIGLDYDRLMLCPKHIQLEYFAAQLDIAISLASPLPLFLHSRAAHDDFVRLLRERLDRLPKRGVVHSFTGEMAEMLELVELGFDIGINGCSLKTEENLEVVKAVPWEKIQFETDGPWCEMRPGHASAKFWNNSKVIGMNAEPLRSDTLVPARKEEEMSLKSVKKEKWVEGAMVKGRNEPCTIGRVVATVAAVKGATVMEASERAWENTLRMFSLGE